jgi:hypothetical protein
LGTTTSAAAFAAPSASTPTGFLYNRQRVCELLHLPVPDGTEPEAKPPYPGQLKLWVPNWNLIATMGRAIESGLLVRESMHVRSKPFAKSTLSSGYITVPLSPPKCGNDKFRKPPQLKASEQLAPLNAVMMAILLRYLSDLDLIYVRHWLITSDKVGDKHVCLFMGDEALIIDLHDDRTIGHADHACAVLIN